ncbi:MAG: hypothetical protein BRC23_02580 [Parcubacteria group bacterium SW_4_49_11]|nr:MAG: hypothetical protein BRC23_02580 [Parcubacteria group bacterium SW_4_49_11]
MEKDKFGLPLLRLETTMGEIQSEYQRSFDADPDETLEDFLKRKGKERADAYALLKSLRRGY